LELNDAQGLRRLYGRIAVALDCGIPAKDYGALATDLVASAGRTQADFYAATPGLETDKAIKSRIDEALSHPRFKWRSIDKVAAAAAIPVDRATELLRTDDRVRFSRGKSGQTSLAYVRVSIKLIDPVYRRRRTAI
jgi:hypothetical protein